MPRVIPSAVPSITPQDIEAVSQALNAGHVALGPEVDLFEQAVAEVVGLPYAVATSSGSLALHAALKVMGCGPGTEIAVPALTFTSTAEAVVHCGGIPVFVDLDEPADVSVYLYGAPPKHHGAWLEDACEALGGKIDGSTVVLSFNGNKIITTGGGGMLLTDNEWIAHRVRAFIGHYKTGEWEHAGVGVNGRMPAMNAALGLSQLKRLDEHVASKRQTARHYYEELLGHTELDPDDNYWMPLLVLDRPARPVIEALRHEGIEARAVFTPLNRVQAYPGPHAPTPKAEHLWRHGLLLPSSVGITWEEREQVVRAVRKVL